MSWLANQIKTAPHKESAKALVAANLEDKYGLSMYNDPPTDEVTIEELERAAIDRLKGVHTRHCQPNPHPSSINQCSRASRRHGKLAATLPKL